MITVLMIFVLLLICYVVYCVLFIIADDLYMCLFRFVHKICIFAAVKHILILF